LAERYEPIIVGRPAFVSFQTAAKLRYRALRRGWGEKRMREVHARIGAAEIVGTGPDLISVYARFRAIGSEPGGASRLLVGGPGNGLVSSQKGVGA
jgi:hypothetical protein